MMWSSQGDQSVYMNSTSDSEPDLRISPNNVYLYSYSMKAGSILTGTYDMYLLTYCVRSQNWSVLWQIEQPVWDGSDPFRMQGSFQVIFLGSERSLILLTGLVPMMVTSKYSTGNLPRVHGIESGILSDCWCVSITNYSSIASLK